MVSPRRTLLNHWALLTRTCSLRSQRLRVVFLSLFHRERILWLILFIKKTQMYILHEGEISFPLVSLCRKGSSWWIEAGGGGVCYFTLLPDQSWTVLPDTHQLTEPSFLILCSGAVSKGQKLAGFSDKGSSAAGNSEGIIIDALRGPPKEAALEETETWNQ